ncbi:MAG: protein kinase [Polyangiaceae bacterium]|nr:protein kinase [Polyangiaceae bacterium]
MWQAERERDGARVALKVGRGDNPLVAERFRRDAEALRLVGPPFVPALFGSGELADGRPFIAMELLRGETLAARFARMEGPPPLEWTAQIAGAILEALAVVHEKGAIHRDLKPENIVLAEDELSCTLIDFGLTRLREAPEPRGLTPQGTVVGTPEYMAPEQLRGELTQDARVDIYAFGVILYELITLRLPFVGDRGAIEHGHLTLRPPRLRELAQVPEALEKLALSCLTKQPERRPPDASALRLALAWSSSLGPSSDRKSEPPSAPISPVAPLSKSAAVSKSSLLIDGRQPAVVLAIEATGGAVEVINAVTARKGLVARQRGGRLVCVFSGMDMDDPVRAAVQVAREIADRRIARAGLHLAPLTIRRKEQGPPAVYGAPVDQPEAWLPRGDWKGVVLTAAVARAMPDIDVGSALDRELGGSPGAAFYRLAASPHGSPAARAVQLAGRDEVISALAKSIDASLSRSIPVLFTLVGDPGLGKSRLAAEAATLVRCMPQRAQLIQMTAAQPLTGKASFTSRELLARVLEVPATDRPPDPREFCIAKLGTELGEEVWRAVSAALGWITVEETGASPWALRQGTMRAIAEGLRRRARERPIAVILDSAHWADEAALDALEYATLDAPGCALWVLVTAHPRFEDMRRSWGSRAERHDRVLLEPLSEEAGMRLAAELLLPAEYPPEATLRQLTSWAGGNPFCLAELIRTLKRAGFVRRRASGSFYVATAELETMPPIAAWQWLAARRLDALTPELAACVRLCSVLGPDFGRQEVDEIQDAIEEAGGAGTPVDAGVGLSALVGAGILVRSGPELFAFQSPTFRDAVYDSLAPSQRLTIHQHALAWWRARGGETEGRRRRLEHVARHAGACGERDQAAAAYLALGEMAQASYQNVVADQRYTMALTFLDDTDARRRALSLAGRGKVRYRIHRMREALEDLALACELARPLGDDKLLANLLLEEATALDHAMDYEGSLRRAEEARTLADRIGAPRLEARVLTALGRSRWRQQRVGEAIDLLGRAASAAKAVGESEARVIALLLLSSALVIVGRLDEAERRFSEVIALCNEMKDRLHLCSAYANRAYLWTARSAPERGLEDLRRAVEIAREIGNPEPERVATHNLAELLHWCGRETDALALARRSRLLEERFAERAAPDDSLLLARIQAARSDFDDAGRLLSWIAERCPPSSATPTVNALFRALKLAVEAHGIEVRPAGAGESWDAVIADAERDLPVEELLEVLYWNVRAALRASRVQDAVATLDRARLRLLESPMWRPRFDALATEVHASSAEAKAVIPPL